LKICWHLASTSRDRLPVRRGFAWEKGSDPPNVAIRRVAPARRCPAPPSRCQETHSDARRKSARCIGTEVSAFPAAMDVRGPWAVALHPLRRLPHIQQCARLLFL